MMGCKFMKASGSFDVRRIFKDSILSIAALLLMNLVLQFIVYPFWNKIYGNDIYGNFAPEQSG
jgi:hypothetical protein